MRRKEIGQLSGRRNIAIMEPSTYKGFVIRPSIFMAKGGQFAVLLTIEKHSYTGIHFRPFPMTKTFGTKEEAEAAARQFGPQIIDGEIPGLSL